VDWVRDLPVFVLVLARTELGLARPGLGTGRNRLTLTLDPLDAASMNQLVDALVPGMPPAALAKITAHAQGIPLFAMETVRALIDQDIVQPSGGVYTLVRDVGELAVPDSLHALLAARLDALNPAVRRLAADAAVLGTSFPADALAAVSGQDLAAVGAGLTDLVRREVLTVSADPLSPERGSYHFTQQMLRQVAYDTLSRRDRKARHLAVARHLRQSFAGDGEEVSDVIVRHYRDALEAVPDDPDVAEIRVQATAALVRAAERSGRTGAPAAAAASYADAAGLSLQNASAGPSGTNLTADELATGALWEKAADAAYVAADLEHSVEYAGRARELYERHGELRAAARAQAAAGNAMRAQGRLTESREQLTAALEVLRAEPDADTVAAMSRLASLELQAGSPDTDRLTAEALALGQALGVADTQLLAELLISRAVCHRMAERKTEAAAYFREAARIATEAGDNMAAGAAVLNLADTLTSTDPKAGAEAARTAAAHLRRAGAGLHLAFAIVNLAQALFMVGDWDAADAELTNAAHTEGLAGQEIIALFRGWLAALRGDTRTALDMLAGLPGMPTSQDVQDQADVALVRAFCSVADGRPAEALGHARAVLARADALGLSHEVVQWAWPVAARAAHDLADAAAATELLGQLEGAQPGHLAPILRAERDLVRARLAGPDDDSGANAPTLAAAIHGLREHSTPYHLAHGLLDQADYLAGLDSGAAEAAISEARDIGERLRCRPLLDRAGSLAGAASPAMR
jgi:predicted ATPase